MRTIVYVASTVIDRKWNPPTKVGITRDLVGRMRTLRTANPLPIGVVFYVETGREEAVFLEREIHGKLATSRLQGEWFSIHPGPVLDVLADIVERLHSDPSSGPYPFLLKGDDL